MGDEEKLTHGIHDGTLTHQETDSAGITKKRTWIEPTSDGTGNVVDSNAPIPEPKGWEAEEEDRK